MENKSLKTLLLLTLTLLFVMGFAVNAFAATTITVQKYDTSAKKYTNLKVTTAEIYNDDKEIKTDVPAMVTSGRTLVPARAVSEALNAKVTWDNAKMRATITKGNDTIVLTAGSAKATVNGKSVALPSNISTELIAYKGSVRTMVPFRFISEQLGVKVAWNNTAKRVTINPKEEDADDWKDWTETYGIQVVIDPGHGGTDPGAIANNTKEKEINLSVAQQVEQNLKKKGLAVIMTRSRDEYLGLVERANVGTESKATIFVSMHCNSATATSASGIETYYYINTDNDYDKDLATCIQNAVIKATDAKSRGVKSANFSVLRNSKIPAALIEMGFLTNVEESTKMNDSEYQAKIAQGVSNGIMNFLKNYDLY